jgi:hypothetical protein
MDCLTAAKGIAEAWRDGQEDRDDAPGAAVTVMKKWHRIASIIPT